MKPGDYIGTVYIGTGWKRLIWNQIKRRAKVEKKNNKLWSFSTEVLARLWYSLTTSSQYHVWRQKPEIRDVLEGRKEMNDIN